ncbi:class I SAM-dependent RNA methyltransferase [Pseudooceanicola sp.]|uniref:THUMP domain-containing class I SAM-dependent RNA methyltransferase n=1 Tax=Pseudooceanicola sp. TaxID=1914328 RepID=UPI002621A3C1|nr:class I SAM-dependent RNA methyltransferase [Pseudooceanicola sp.]MDF1854772.1 class I SAM-dependent RNA methyltransferase [Pseudooceanicola sp.]
MSISSPPEGAPGGLFLAAPPGLEAVLAEEARELGLTGVSIVAGGVETDGGWAEVQQANLWLRGATRVLWHIASFRALHLAQLDKRARRLDWAAILRPDVAVRIETTCRKSRIYHAGAATQRVARAITETLGAPRATEAGTGLLVRVRIEDDLCTISIDTSGEPLHRRGHKLAVGKAPIRESMAALFLRQCGYDGSEPVLDPMCGSGTFPIEAAEIAAGLAPGRSRGFAFEQLAGFDATAWQGLRADAARPGTPGLTFYGRDRDQGAIRMATENAERAGVAALTQFACQPISALTRPEGAPGLIMVNPPYGDRIGNRNLLFGLYGSLGQVLRDHFRGWRLGMVTSDGGLAKATGLNFAEIGPPVPHGGLSVKLYRTDALR